MDLKKLEKVLALKNKAIKEFPFGDKAMVFKVKNKIFTILLWQENPLRLNLKCDPIDALAFREIYECVDSAYHMNKKHWNTVTLDGSMEDQYLVDMIDDSYNLVVSKFTKKEQIELIT